MDHPSDTPCIAVVLPDSLLRTGVVATLGRLGVIIHQSEAFDPLECTPLLLVVEPSHLTECALLYAGLPTLTVSLFESAVVATPATPPDEMLSRVRKMLAPSPQVHHLSARERQVLALVATGRSTDEIAEVCYISRETVNTHLTRIFRKLGAPNRAAAVSIAARHGLLTL